MKSCSELFEELFALYKIKLTKKKEEEEEKLLLRRIQKGNWIAGWIKLSFVRKSALLFFNLLRC